MVASSCGSEIHKILLIIYEHLNCGLLRKTTSLGCLLKVVCVRGLNHFVNNLKSFQRKLSQQMVVEHVSSLRTRPSLAEEEGLVNLHTWILYGIWPLLSDN